MHRWLNHSAPSKSWKLDAEFRPSSSPVGLGAEICEVLAAEWHAREFYATTFLGLQTVVRKVAELLLLPYPLPAVQGGTRVAGKPPSGATVRSGHCTARRRRPSHRDRTRGRFTRDGSFRRDQRARPGRGVRRRGPRARVVRQHQVRRSDQVPQGRQADRARLHQVRRARGARLATKSIVLRRARPFGAPSRPSPRPRPAPASPRRRSNCSSSAILARAVVPPSRSSD